ncbi:MAG: hypothetical protein AAGA81_22605 [Acidobacteriota bacterium]
MTAVAATSAVVFALSALASSTTANWKRTGSSSKRAPTWLSRLGWTALALSLAGYLAALGWLRALPWWALALGLGASFVTAWLSLFPKLAQRTVGFFGLSTLVLAAVAVGTSL